MSMKPDTTDSILYPGPTAPGAQGRAIEPWFTILLCALLPLVGALFVPSPWQFALQVLGGLMCVAGLVLLVRHELTLRRQQNVTER
jgi:hypothetical protein